MNAPIPAEFDYEEKNDGTYAVSVLSATQHLTYPIEHCGKRVTEIRADWEPLSNRNLVERVTLPEGIEIIGYQSFFEMRSLKEADLPQSLTEIEDFAFGSCDTLSQISLPPSVQKIGIGAFYRCKALEQVSLSSALCEIGKQAFSGCEQLTSIRIPKGVREIGLWAFEDCPSMKMILVDSENPFFCSIDGVLYSADKTQLIRYPAGKTATEFTVPEGVTEIADSAFLAAPLLKVLHLPSTLRIIGDAAFCGCNALTVVNLPKGIQFIGEDAFFDCPLAKN